MEKHLNGDLGPTHLLQCPTRFQVQTTPGTLRLRRQPFVDAHGFHRSPTWVGAYPHACPDRRSPLQFHFYRDTVAPLRPVSVVALSIINRCCHCFMWPSKLRVRSIVIPSSCNTFSEPRPTTSDAEMSPSPPASSTASYSTTPATVHHPPALTPPRASSSSTASLRTKEPRRRHSICTITGALSPAKHAAVSHHRR
jgi:hypothetical protein